MFKIASYVTMVLKHLLRNILKAAHYRQICCTFSVLSSVHTKAILNARACAANFKQTCVSVVLCTGVRTVHKFCSPVDMFLYTDTEK